MFGAILLNKKIHVANKLNIDQLDFEVGAN